MVELSECCFRGCSGCNIYYEMFPELNKTKEEDNKDGSME